MNDQIMQEEKERCTTCACWYSLLFIVIRENIYSGMKSVAEEWLRKKKITLFPFKSLYLCHRLNCVTSKMLSRGNKKNQMPNRTIIISSHFALFNIDVLKHNDVVKTVIWFCYVEMSFLSIKALSYSLKIKCKIWFKC